MKLRNKKTGEIKEWSFVMLQNVMQITEEKLYNSLAQLNDEWEDYEEPKEYWYINEFGTPTKADFVGRETLYDKCRKNFGNYFETKEEVEKAVEKLKAWKRLKDKGFRFDSWENDKEKYLGDFVIYAHAKDLTGIIDDLDLLFGGEE